MSNSNGGGKDKKGSDRGNIFWVMFNINLPNRLECRTDREPKEHNSNPMITWLVAFVIVFTDWLDINGIPMEKPCDCASYLAVNYEAIDAVLEDEWSLEEAAEKFNVPVRTLARWVSGKTCMGS